MLTKSKRIMPTNEVPSTGRTREIHGLQRLKQAVRDLGGRVIDRRTRLGKALASWKGQLLCDLGGHENVSTQQLAVVELAVKTKLMLDSIDAWLLTQPSLVNARKRAVLPVVLQRQQLADGLARYMAQLGLKRRAKPALTIQDYMAARQDRQDREESSHEDTAPDATSE